MCVLGRLGVENADGTLRAASLPGRRAEVVFAYLAVEHRRMVSRDELADALWPDELPAAWAAALRGVVSDVRRFLADAEIDPEAVLLSTGGGYGLRLPAGVRLDLDDARVGLAAAEADLRGGAPGSAARAALEVASAAQLPFLPAHDGAWVDGLRRELERLAIAGLETAARAWAGAGDVSAAAAAAERLVRLDALNERAHQLRIRILGEAGDRAGALVAYQECCDVLSRELGSGPSAETEETFRRVVAAAPATGTVTGNVVQSVLVVEDHDFQRRAAVQLLRGLRVTTVTDVPDAQRALEVLEGGRWPDVVLCDIDMPGIDGVELVRRLGALGYAGSLVITSALDDGVRRAVESVASGYGLTVLGTIEKPLSSRRLADVLQRHRSAGVGPEAMPDRAGGVSIATFAPVVDLSTGSPAGAVAAPVAEGQAVDGQAWRQLDRSVRAAVAAHDLWRGRGWQMPVIVPVPTSALAEVDVVDRLVESAGEAGSGPQACWLSMTSAVLRRDPTVLLDVLARLRLKGFGLALTVTEASSASLALLADLPLTVAHLDGPFVAGAHAASWRLSQIESVLDAATDAGLRSVVGGCNSPADYEALLGLGCQLVHGDHLAAPGTPAAVAAWIDDWTNGSPTRSAP